VAGPYTIVGQYPDVIVLGTGKTQDVQVIQFTTIPHGTYVETSLARNIATTANIKAQVNGLATHYEQIWSIPGVAGLAWTQEPNASGFLEDHIIVYVSSTSGDSSGQLDFPYSQFSNDVIEAGVTNLRAALDATEAP
jgi:hypothetical protein